ncbi:hypothetical protein [Niastella sp. OAS944]|uniref:OB-fold protein n=1 Tax=Niastella sp. OAS944 TaxID=2664089 RepID=UPI0034883CD9|nr:hypothetical protein [Chitinophagaceae bacterium OAS944]
MRNIAFLLGCCLVAFLAGLLIYFYNKPTRNVAAETGISITAAELYAQFNTDHLQANEVYLNKVLQVSGQVLSIKNTPYAAPVVILNTGNPECGIACLLNHLVAPTAHPVKPGETIIIKGICTGYVNHVVLSNSSLVN